MPLKSIDYIPYCFYSERFYFIIQLKRFMRNESAGAVLLFILAMYSAASVSWYSPSNYLPAAIFAAFPIVGALGVIILAAKRKSFC